MPRRNRNVRQRNVPRAAQVQKRKYTERTQFDVRPVRRYTRQPSAQDRIDEEYPRYA